MHQAYNALMAGGNRFVVKSVRYQNIQNGDCTIVE
jgi:hypothetical protein